MTTEELEQITKNSSKVLVKFGAEWCGPCKQIAKILEELPSDITVVDLDVDDNDELVSSYNIRNIPALFYYVNGEQVNKSVGSITKEDLLSKF